MVFLCMQSAFLISYDLWGMRKNDRQISYSRKRDLYVTNTLRESVLLSESTLQEEIQNLIRRSIRLHGENYLLDGIGNF